MSLVVLRAQVFVGALVALSGCGPAEPTGPVEPEPPRPHAPHASACPELRELDDGPVGELVREVCVLEEWAHEEAFVTGSRVEPGQHVSPTLERFDCVALEFTDAQLLGLVRSGNAVAASYGRYLLHVRRAWTPERIEGALDSRRDIGISYGHLYAMRLGAWADAVHALVDLRDQAWARARLVEVLGEEVPELRASVRGGRASSSLRAVPLARALLVVGPELDLDEDVLDAWSRDAQLPALVRAAAAIVPIKRGREGAIESARAVALSGLEGDNRRLAVMWLAEALGDDEAWGWASGRTHHRYGSQAFVATRFGLRRGEDEALAVLEHHEVAGAVGLVAATDELIREHAPWALCEVRLDDETLFALRERLDALGDEARCAIMVETLPRAPWCEGLAHNLSREPALATGCEAFELGEDWPRSRCVGWLEQLELDGQAQESLR